MFLAKFNATNGNVIWAKAAGGIDDDVSHGVTTDTHGNIFLVGDYFSPSIVFGSNTLTNSNGGNTDDAFIAKYDSLGNDVWAKSAGGSNYDIAFSVSSNGYDSIFVAGFFYSDTITFNASTIASNKGLFVIKLDDNGNLVWIKDAVGLGAAVSVVAVASGSVYVTGDFFEPAITFDATILNNSSSDSSADVFIAKLDMVTGLSNVSVAPGFLSIYPNPFNDEFVINGTTQKGKIIILDAMNKEVLSQKTINGETKINTCNLKPGFYILRYIKDGRVINSKLIKN